jgi:hypothetical protein
MRPTVATITPASATEGSPAVFEFSLSNPSAIAVDYTFTFTNGTAGSADYYFANSNCTCGCYYGNCVYLQLRC